MQTIRKNLARVTLASLLAVMIAAPAWAAGAPARQSKLTIRDLGTLGGTQSEARGINNRGEVVGWSDTADGFHHAFLWRHGKMIDLGVLGGHYSQANAINDRGQVVGWSTTAEGFDPSPHAFLWERGKMTDLGVLGQSHFSEATAINERGEVVVTGVIDAGPQYSFVWKHRVVTPLGGVDESSARGINDRGEIVGGSVAQSPALPHAYRLRNGVRTDLGTGTGVASEALGVNNRGDIVGVITLWSGFGQHAFLWRRGVMTELDLGSDLSAAQAINDRGQLVGSTQVDDNPNGPMPVHAFVWRHGILTDLGTLANNLARFSTALAINRRGQIAGSSDVSPNSFTLHAVLWS
jgi:probable HAF family extracellular repeat protein